MKHCIFKHFQHQLAFLDPEIEWRMEGDDEEMACLSNGRD